MWTIQNNLRKLSNSDGTARMRRCAVPSSLNSKRPPTRICCSKQPIWQGVFTGAFRISLMFSHTWSKLDFCQVRVSDPTWFCLSRANWKCALFVYAAMKVAFKATHVPTAWVSTALRRRINAGCATECSNNPHRRRRQLKICNNEPPSICLNKYLISSHKSLSN